MGFLKLSKLALLSLLAVNGFAQEPVIDDEVRFEQSTTGQSPSLAVKVSASFPQSEIFGVKLINGHPTQALLSFINEEPETPINVAFIGANLWAAAPPGSKEAKVGLSEMIVRNLTTTRYNVQIPAGERESVAYSFATELHPQDMRLTVTAVLTTDMGGLYQVTAYNETVSIVEPDASLFDPQLIFLYLFLFALFGATCYFIYNTWITTLFPQKAGRGKGGERAKRSSGGSKKVDPSEQVSVLGADGPAVASGAKAYDESWIPAHHIQRPEAKRVKSGGPGKSPRTPKTPKSPME